MLTPENIYNGLSAAFTGAPIGVDSNDISKIWNSEVFVTGTDKEKEEAIKCVKWLCMENNFHIDYAKTLYKPERPPEVSDIITKYTRTKLPAFFEFAKDKEENQIATRNGSFVNNLYDKIPNKPINTRGLDLPKLNYKEIMMSNKNIRCSKDVSDLYDSLNKRYRYMINMKDEYVDNLRYVACSLRNEFSKTGYSNEMITDMLVEYLYKNQKRYKQLLWFCYGQYVVNNIETNLSSLSSDDKERLKVEFRKTKYIQCIDCGEWVEVDLKDNKTLRCKSCQLEEKRRIDREYRRKKRMSI